MRSRAVCLAAALAVALVVAAAAGGADAYNPMKRNGPVSPFAFTPAPDAAEVADATAAPESPLAPPVPPAPPAVQSGAAAIATNDVVKAINKAVDTYFRVWTYSGAGAKFDAAPAMALYVDTPRIHDLMINFEALKHLKLTFDYTGPTAKSDYAKAMNSLYNSVASFALTEEAGTRRVVVAPDLRSAMVYVDFKSIVKPHHLPGVPLNGRAVLSFAFAGTRSNRQWRIAKERLSPRAPAAVAAAVNAVRHPVTAIKNAFNKNKF